MSSDEKFMRIMKKVQKRYNETYKNRAMLVDPQKKNFKPMMRDMSCLKVGKYMLNFFKKEKYFGKRLVVLCLSVDYKEEKIYVRTSFSYNNNGKKSLSYSYGGNVTFDKKEILALGDLTHAVLWKVVNQVIHIKGRCFKGIAPVSYTELMEWKTKKK